MRVRACFAISASAGVIVVAGLAGATVASATSPKATAQRNVPLVIGHRGASAYRPEHTLGSYQLAIDMGADYIEPDLVSTKDRVLVARHENEISGTTDVAAHPEFAARRKAKTIDGVAVTGWFTEDFSLAELKTLRAIERLPALRPANTAFDGAYQIPTLQEVIELAKREGVGIYPETKHPTYFDSIGLSLEEPLIKILRANGLDRRDADVFVQSFEVSNLQELSRELKVPLVQLTGATGRPYDFTAKGDPRTYADLTTPNGLRGVARYADGLGPDKAQIVPRDAQNRLLAPTSLVADAHRAGLQVHPYTFRPENSFLSEDQRAGNPASPEYLRARGNQPAELKLFFRLGVDGVFADNPDTAVAVRRKVFGRS
jgi:glycerophosphoryl diester phosphodiesterase